MFIVRWSAVCCLLHAYRDGDPFLLHSKETIHEITHKNEFQIKQVISRLTETRILCCSTHSWLHAGFYAECTKRVHTTATNVHFKCTKATEVISGRSRSKLKQCYQLLQKSTEKCRNLLDNHVQ